MAANERSRKMSEAKKIMAADIEELAECGYMDPVLVRWEDDGELEIVAGPNLNDVSWSDYGRDHQVVIRLADILQGAAGDSIKDEQDVAKNAQAIADMLII